MRAILIHSAAVMALLTGAPSIAKVDAVDLLVVAIDNSSSFPVVVDHNIARSAGNSVESLVADMDPGDRVKLRSFGLAGIASQQINVDVTVGRKASMRPRRIARAVGDLVGSMPDRVANGDLEVQDRTNIVGFIEALAPSLDCESTPTRILLFTDGIESSTQLNENNLLSGSADLPRPTGPILEGCTVEIRGLGQVVTEQGTDSRWFPLLRTQWTAFFEAAGAASFKAYAEFE